MKLYFGIIILLLSSAGLCSEPEPADVLLVHLSGTLPKPFASFSVKAERYRKSKNLKSIEVLRDGESLAIPDYIFGLISQSPRLYTLKVQHDVGRDRSPNNIYISICSGSKVAHGIKTQENPREIWRPTQYFISISPERKFTYETFPCNYH